MHPDQSIAEETPRLPAYSPRFHCGDEVADHLLRTLGPPPGLLTDGLRHLAKSAGFPVLSVRRLR